MQPSKKKNRKKASEKICLLACVATGNPFLILNETPTTATPAGRYKSLFVVFHRFDVVSFHT